MKKIALFLAPGFEEGEATTIVDVLRRAQFVCNMVSITSEYVAGAHNIVIKADRILPQNIAEFPEYDMLVLPGGWTGVDNMKNDVRLLQLLRKYNTAGKYIAAMCAAPNVLAVAGITKGRRVTSYPGDKCEPYFADAQYVQDVVAFDKNMVTSRGPGTALPFVFALVDVLGGDSALIKERFLYNMLKAYQDNVEEG